LKILWRPDIAAPRLVACPASPRQFAQRPATVNARSETTKRIVLFLATNIAVVVLLSIILNVLGLNRYLDESGINVGALLAFSLVVGFTGSIFSLLISKPMAKLSTGARVLDDPTDGTELWLVATVQRLAEKAGIGMPEVAVYEGEPNAFTGAFRNRAGRGLDWPAAEHEPRGSEAVLGHEIGHVANGDMVTLTLIQGVINTFVVFFARIVGYFVDKTVFRTERGVGPGFYITVFACEIVFGILASMIVMWFSRQREFRADAASAGLLGSPRPMMKRHR
jgi:heat shock protein HtpX